MERILGLDIGDKTIGVAVSDLLHFTAQGLTTIRRTNIDEDIKKIESILQEYDSKKLVVGLPYNMDGSLGFQGEKTKSFVETVKKKLDVNIIYEDERLTTMAAEKMLISTDMRRENRKKIIDQVAATYILQTYLDRKGR